MIPGITATVDLENRIKCGFCGNVEPHPGFTTMAVRRKSGSWRASGTDLVDVYVCPGCGAIHKRGDVVRTFQSQPEDAKPFIPNLCEETGHACRYAGVIGCVRCSFGKKKSV